ncbi:hypothetical protein GCM10010387_00090 [Streptomyces inusitatus]|uniref:Uncharacterized protein n=1 Tax=Streptomyces inusitatus TaxID=68221 RepID=A0A918PIW2_9ACTN|nr:hypothetical protein [Streptomyces inusitatus]GGZ12239.1 hypothetical protein GCM10010387_00090 [Streptomyces inusitatus]
MRDSIARALTWALHLITPGRGRRRDTAKPTIHQRATAEGRHRATTTPAPSRRAPERIAVPLQGLRDPFERRPGHAPDLPEIPPVRSISLARVKRAEERREAQQRRERRTAMTLAAMGIEYTYLATTGVHQVTGVGA